MQKPDQAKRKEFVDIGKQTYKAVFPDGSTKTVTYSEIKKHNNAIIEDNCMYGLMHPADYTPKEVNEYECKARAENKFFLAFLRTCPCARIAFDQTTELYQAVPYLASEEDAAE